MFSACWSIHMYMCMYVLQSYAIETLIWCINTLTLHNIHTHMYIAQSYAIETLCNAHVNAIETLCNAYIHAIETIHLHELLRSKLWLCQVFIQHIFMQLKQFIEMYYECNCIANIHSTQYFSSHWNILIMSVHSTQC